MEEFDFSVAHRPGRNHENADALSRRPHTVNVIRGVPATRGESINLPTDWSLDMIVAEQKADKDIGWVMQKKLESETAPSHEEMRNMSPVVKTLVAQWPQLDLHAGLLTRMWLDAEETDVRWRQIILPVARRNVLIRLAHEGMNGGHLGIRRTMAHVQKRAYWPNWKEDVQVQLRQCVPCARYCRGKPKRQGNLQNLVVGAIGEIVAIDVSGPHPTSAGGYKYILSVLDQFSRWAEAYPMRNQEAQTVAKILVDQWFTRYGCPSTNSDGSRDLLRGCSLQGPMSDDGDR